MGDLSYEFSILFHEYMYLFCEIIILLLLLFCVSLSRLNIIMLTALFFPGLHLMYRYFVFIYDFEDLFSSSVKNGMDILFDIALNLYIAFCKLIIFISVFLLCQYRRFLHL